MATLSGQELTNLAIAAGFPQDIAPTMAAIALAESGGRTDAVSPANSNGSRDYGLWQINNRAWAALFHDFNWNDPGQNASMAYIVYIRQGLNAWSVYKSGRYQMYMNRTGSANGSGVPPTNTPTGTGTGTPVSSGSGGLDLFDWGTYARIGLFLLGSLLLGIALYTAIPTASVAKTVSKVI